jgi:Protoglobin
MLSKCPIAGYTFGEDSIPASPVSLEELHKLEAATGWSEEDALWLKIAAETLIPQAEAIVDSWRSMIGSLPPLAASFVGPDGKPDDHYKSSIRLRFVQWVSDVCIQPRDQKWLDYQEEIGLRHLPAKKNKTDNAQTPPVVPQRYLLGFTAVVITTIRGFLVASGRPEEDIVRIQDAWTRAVLLSVTLWSRSYAREGLW